MSGEKGWPFHLGAGKDLPGRKPTSAEVDNFLAALAVTTPPAVFSRQPDVLSDVPANSADEVPKPSFEIPVIEPVSYPLVTDPYIPRTLLEHPPFIDLPLPPNK